MTKIIYGDDSVAMTAGVIEINGIRTPFFGFADKKAVIAAFPQSDGVRIGDETQKIFDFFSDKGTIVVIDNPQAAHNFSKFIHGVFTFADKGPWGEKEYIDKTVH